MIGYFNKLGVEITSNEAKKLVEKYFNFDKFKINFILIYFFLNVIRINKNGSLMIEPNEWKEFFFLYNIDDPMELLHHWRHSAVRIYSINLIIFNLSSSEINIFSICLDSRLR